MESGVTNMSSRIIPEHERAGYLLAGHRRAQPLVQTCFDRIRYFSAVVFYA